MINTTIIKQHNSDTDLFRQWTCLTGLTIDIEIDEPQYITISGYMDVHHRGLVNGVVGYAGTLSILYSDSLRNLPQAPVWSTLPADRIQGSTNGGNILNETQHYGKIIWCGSKLLQPGAHRIMAHGNSHSSINGNSTDGLVDVLVEGGLGLNCLIANFCKA